MYWNDLNKDNIELVKEYYYDYLEENKNTKYTSELMSLEEFMENNLTKCKMCDKPELLRNTKDTFNYGSICMDCYENTFNKDEWQDNYEEYKLREEGLL